MRQIKPIPVFVAILVAASIRIYKVQTEKKVGEERKNILTNLCENSYKI